MHKALKSNVIAWIWTCWFRPEGSLTRGFSGRLSSLVPGLFRSIETKSFFCSVALSVRRWKQIFREEFGLIVHRAKPTL
ncbi:hypothetical protein HU200_018901 [Digitaria exilis]|uniref:Uncharacterized protein n=1 Tax=Digitaria exilis TaxID=1010633 RepID=A0A835KHG5_9POAL|nr:hypothetical protein HU200_018901 [Digitaria exilis]